MDSQFDIRVGCKLHNRYRINLIVLDVLSLLLFSEQEHPVNQKAPSASKDKRLGTEMMISARSVNMSSSCNVSC